MSTSLALMKQVLGLLERGEPFALCTVVVARGSVPAKPGAKMIVLENGQQFGTVGGAGLEENVKARALECQKKKQNGIFRFDLSRYKTGGLDSLCGGSVEIAIEVMTRRPHILLAGGGHVAFEVARLCTQLEYAFSVLDARSEFASAERFPGARELHVADPAKFLATESLDTYTHVLVLGHSHHIDSDVLEQLLRRFPHFIGVISSRAKQKDMFKQMQERGFSDSDLKRVEAPVGMPIGSETPAEIAVSILASIIRNHKCVG